MSIHVPSVVGHFAQQRVSGFIAVRARESTVSRPLHLLRPWILFYSNVEFLPRSQKRTLENCPPGSSFGRIGNCAMVSLPVGGLSTTQDKTTFTLSTACERRQLLFCHVYRVIIPSVGYIRLCVPRTLTRTVISCHTVSRWAPFLKQPRISYTNRWRMSLRFPSSII